MNLKIICYLYNFNFESFSNSFKKGANIPQDEFGGIFTPKNAQTPP